MTKQCEKMISDPESGEELTPCPRPATSRLAVRFYVQTSQASGQALDSAIDLFACGDHATQEELDRFDLDTLTKLLNSELKKRNQGTIDKRLTRLFWETR